MKTVNINASTNSKRIPIGRCEDNEATRVVFDCSGFSSAYGSGQATLLHRRSKEKISYIVQNVTQEDDAVTWTVSSDDTAFSGEGTLQLMWTVNDVVAHSVFYTTITDPSLTDSSSEPTEVKSALQLLIDSCYTKTEVDEAIANVPTGANWNASEGESGYIENRPFYSETVEGEEVVHQLDPKYISGKFITSGTGENSEIFNDINNRATGSYSHAEGLGTIATASACHVGGKYNIEDTWSSYAEIIGNGTSNINRSNARTLDWSGNESLAGSLTLGMNTNDEITITPAQLAKLLYPFRENHWESPKFIFPSAYVTADSATLYTEEEAMAMSGDVRTIYYFPEEIDLDAISTIDVSVCAVYRSDSEIIPMLAHQALTSFSENLNVLWSSNCKGFLMASFIYITRASDFHSPTGEAYAFPSNVKTIAVLSMSNKPDSSGRLPSFIQSISFDWTPSE